MNEMLIVELLQLLTLGLIGLLFYRLNKRNNESFAKFMKRLNEISTSLTRTISLPMKHEGIIEVVKKQGDAWVHFGWVRRNSPAWRAALDKPGFALRDDGKIEEGIQ